MKLQQDLSAIWRDIVQAGQVRSQFVDSNGRRLECGLRMGGDGPEHYALDIDSGAVIRSGVSERQLEGSSFRLQLNQYRALKPKPATLGLGRQADSSADAADCLFACQDPANALSLLRREIHIQVKFVHHHWAAVHNALPIEQYGHFLWVPIRAHGAMLTYPHWIQSLSLPLLEDFLSLAANSTEVMTFYNSMHAGGSVNHIHYHSVHRPGDLPLEQAETISRDGYMFLKGYPASGLVYGEDTAPERMWSHLEKLQSRGIPINLIHCSHRTFLFARNTEHEVVQEFPSGILAGMELAGRPITTEESFYRSANFHVLRTALEKSTLRDEEVLQILES